MIYIELITSIILITVFMYIAILFICKAFDFFGDLFFNNIICLFHQIDKNLRARFDDQNITDNNQIQIDTHLTIEVDPFKRMTKLEMIAERRNKISNNLIDKIESEKELSGIELSVSVFNEANKVKPKKKKIKKINLINKF